MRLRGFSINSDNYLSSLLYRRLSLLSFPYLFIGNSTMKIQTDLRWKINGLINNDFTTFGIDCTMFISYYYTIPMPIIARVCM